MKSQILSELRKANDENDVLEILSAVMSAFHPDSFTSEVLLDSVQRLEDQLITKKFTGLYEKKSEGLRRRFINNFVGSNPIEVIGINSPATSGLMRRLVLICQNGGSISFQHSMTPAQARQCADALIASCEELLVPPFTDDSNGDDPLPDISKESA